MTDRTVIEAAARVINQASRPNGVTAGAVTCQVPLALLRQLQEALAAQGIDKFDTLLTNATRRTWPKFNGPEA